jgi:hypothetical protein
LHRAWSGGKKYESLGGEEKLQGMDRRMDSRASWEFQILP